MTKLKNFFLEPTSPQPLALLRIGLSLVLLWQAFALSGSAQDFFGNQGILQGAVNDYLTLPLGQDLPRIPDVARWLGLSNGAAVRLLFTVYLFGLTCLITGLRTRGAALLTWITHGLLLSTGYFASYGVDRFAQIALFYFLFFPIGATLSIDRREGRETGEASAIARLGVRVIQLHLCIAYAAAGLEKAMGVEWWNGEAIWRALMLPQFGRLPIEWLSEVPWLAKLACWSTLLLEIGYPIFIWPRATRRFWVLAALGMHLGIAVAMGLVSFSAVMGLLTLCLFGSFPELAASRRSPQATAYGIAS